MLFFLLCRDASDSSSHNDVEIVPPPAKKSKTLLDFANSEISWPRLKNTDQVTYLNKYSHDYASDSENSIKELDSYIKNCKAPAKVLQYDSILILFKKHCNGVFEHNLQTFKSFCLAVRDLLWYAGPHHEKLKARGAAFPRFLIYFFCLMILQGISINVSK